MSGKRQRPGTGHEEEQRAGRFVNAGESRIGRGSLSQRDGGGGVSFAFVGFVACLRPGAHDLLFEKRRFLLLLLLLQRQPAHRGCANRGWRSQPMMRRAVLRAKDGMHWPVPKQPRDRGCACQPRKASRTLPRARGRGRQCAPGDRHSAGWRSEKGHIHGHHEDEAERNPSPSPPPDGFATISDAHSLTLHRH